MTPRTRAITITIAAAWILVCFAVALELLASLPLLAERAQAVEVDAEGDAFVANVLVFGSTVASVGSAAVALILAVVAIYLSRARNRPILWPVLALVASVCTIGVALLIHATPDPRYESVRDYLERNSR